MEKVALAAVGDLETLGADAASLPDLERLAKAGTNGTNPQNLHRDIMNAVKDRTTLEPSQFHIPFQNFGEQMQLMTLPHAQFAHLYHQYPNSFRKRVLPENSDLSDFWQGMDGHPAVDGLDLEGVADKTVPFALHGDEVPITGVGKVWSKSALTFQYFSMMAASTGLATKQLLMWVWSVFEKLCIPGVGGTVDTFMRIFKWSWESLKSGKWPEEDWQGHRLLSLYPHGCVIFVGFHFCSIAFLQKETIVTPLRVLLRDTRKMCELIL